MSDENTTGRLPGEDATPLDVPELMELWRSSWPHSVSGVLSADSQRAYLGLHEKEYWAHLLADPDNRIRVARQQSHIVGMSQFGPWVNRQMDVELRRLYVRPDLFRTGIASSLLSDFHSVSRRSDAYLWVYAENLGARSFYERFSWVPSGRSKRMHIGQEAPIMVEYVWTDSK